MAGDDSTDDEHPSVTVMLAVLDAEATIGAQLDALAGQTYPGWWEVLVADNGCTDGSMAIVEAARHRFPALRVIDTSARRDGAYAKNRAVEAARGEILVSCDADDVVQPGWIEALVDELAACDIAFGVGDMEALNPPVVNQWNWSRGAGPIRVGMGGGNIGCRRAVWEDLGGWTEGVRCADTDFRLRAEEAGYRIAVTHRARILVRHRSTLGALVRRSFDFGVGVDRLVADHPQWAARDAGVAPGRVVRHLGFLLVFWPAALVSPGARGLWLRIAAFNLGRGWGRVRRRSTPRTRDHRPRPTTSGAPTGAGPARHGP